MDVRDQITKVQKNEKILNALMRFGYVIYTVPAFTTLSSLETTQKKFFGIEIFSVMFVFIIVYSFVVLYIIQENAELRKPLRDIFKAKKRFYMKYYLPALIFLASIGLMWLSEYVQFYYIITSIISLILIELFIRYENKSLREII